MNYLVFDVGGTAIKYALMDSDCNFLHKSKMDTPAESFTEFETAIRSIYETYEHEISGVSFSLPGIIDTEKGITVTGGSLTYNNQREFVSSLAKWMKHPISIENDAKCALLAEADQGSLRDCNHALMIVLGTGIGGGILVDRKVYKGSRFAAGEFSFVLRDHHHQAGQPFHYWGFDGSVRGLCHAVAVAKQCQKSTVNGELIFQWISENDETVTQIFEQYTYELAMQCYSLQAMFDPEKIAIGGGISANQLLIESIQRHIKTLQTTLPITIGIPTVVRAAFMNDANLIGALMHHFRHFTI